MKGVYTRSTIETRLKAAFSNTDAIRTAVQNPVPPDDVAEWLGDLALLQGVPFNYLVPDEGMLPPESIRFFYLDSNWVEALLDGANSIGRNLTADTQSHTLKLDAAVRPDMLAHANRMRAQARPKLFGMKADLLNSAPDMKVISGFILRSSLVSDYKDMGIDVYPLHGTPSDPSPQLLTILRMERLNATSDTLICLVQGDAYRVDIHEAPQTLHYGIDCFNNQCQVGGNSALAVKQVHTFGINTSTENGIATNKIVMSEAPTAIDISTAMRSDSRVVSMSSLANLILQVNQTAPLPPDTTTRPTSIDSASMGFEMTEGVGMVSFYKTT